MGLPLRQAALIDLLQVLVNYLNTRSVSQRTITDWNNLSHDCVNASSVNMFKNKIDNYMARAGYT